MYLNFDPSLLAVPNHASSQSEAETIIARLRYWAKPCFFSGAFQGLILGDTLNVLADGGFFPSSPNISELLTKFDLRHVYSSEDVRRSINFVLERARVVEDVLEVEAKDCALCSSQPDLTAFRNKQPLFDATVRLLVTLSIASPKAFADLAPVVVPGFPDVVGDVSIRGTAQDGAILQPEWDTTFPLSVLSKLLFVDSVPQLTDCAGAKSLWDSAEMPEQLHLALTVEASQVLSKKGLDGDPSNVPAFRLGSEFFRSASQYEATGWRSKLGDLLREACARIIVGDPKNPIGPLNRRDRFGNMKQIVRQRDGAVACRTHLSKRHEALRLMFWRLSDGDVEFANVGPKSELVIELGSTDSIGRSDCWG